MGVRHAYTYAAGVYADQIQRALMAPKGEPHRVAVEEMVASTCWRLGCSGVSPNEWNPIHIMNTLREESMIEADRKSVV